MKTLVVIPARGGSKGIPGKNIKSLAGKPLIQYTIDAAKSVFDVEDICVSTDSNEIASAVESLGIKIPFLRPAALATDTSSTYDVLLHALHFFKEQGKDYEVVVLLQPTSPFRSAEDIRNALAIYSQDIDMVVSVKETDANPYYVLFEENENGFLEKSKQGNFSSRQECPLVWQYNGAVYIINAASLIKQSHLLFKKVKKYIMPSERSLDIDTSLDWKFAEFLFSESK